MHFIPPPHSLSLPLSSLSPLLCRPKSDSCNTCDAFKVKVDAETDPQSLLKLQSEWELHKRKAERAYQQMREDSALAHSDSSVEMLTFDLQRSLPTPVLTTNLVYYKRQLWTYNLGIHNCATENACMHVWHEGIASRGSDEVGSAILNHINHMTTSATSLIVYIL